MHGDASGVAPPSGAAIRCCPFGWKSAIVAGIGREAPDARDTLHPSFGVEIHDLGSAPRHAADGYAAIRAAFETHSLLLFRGQRLDDAAHARPRRAVRADRGPLGRA